MHRNPQEWAGALVALAFAAITQPALASPPPFPGTTVYIPPLATLENPDPAPSERVMRLPSVAGKVTRVITTNLLKASPSWLVQGDKYWSLCAPRRTQIACSPITAVSTMQDIHIRAYAGDNNAPTVAYDVMPQTTRTAAELAVAMDYFHNRLASKVAHFDRINPNADPRPPKGQLPRKGAAKPLLIAEGSTSYCTYDDFGSIDCSGGDGGGGGGGGTDTWEYDWTPDETYEDAAASDPPPPSSIPTFPAGPDSDTAQADPCIGPNGNKVCQQITITGQRPSTEACVWGMFGRVCVSTPPPIVDPFAPTLPPSPAPIWPQGACNLINAMCSNGQTPETDNERVPARGDTYADDIQACADNLEVEETQIYAYPMDQRTRSAKLGEARRRYSACLTAARRRHGVSGTQSQ